VNENDIARISKGDSVEIVFDALRHEVFGGIVTKIANSSKNTGYNTGQVASFEVNILIEGESEHLRPGMSASVTINTEKKRGYYYCSSSVYKSKWLYICSLK
jgi:multidrug resistance efflux pump